MDVQLLHHISLPVADVERSRRFYREVMRLAEIPRPDFPFPGVWYSLGDRELHYAVRVSSYREALDHLHARGYREDAAPDDPTRLVLRPHAVTGYPQIYVLDPDRHLIEINAERLDV